MKNRRIFLKHAGALALGGLLLPGCSNQKSNQQETTTDTTDTTATNNKTAATGNLGPIGIQLYTVKDLLDKDLKGTLQQLADIGYKEIESYPGIGGHYYGMEPKEFKDLLSGMGLTLVSSHFGAGKPGAKIDNWHQATILQDLPTLLEKAAQTGQQYLTCSSLDESMWKTKDDLKKTAEMFNKTGESVKKAGMQFAYHNHDYEFTKVEDVLMFDFLVENTDPELVKWELDIFWVLAGGQDPVAYLKKYPNRFPLSHIKDMDKNDKTKNTEIGTGALNLQEVLKAAKDGGMKHFLVEQENFSIPIMESMKINYNYLSKVSV
jgi:sugar phosphate isomerase/epimerase